MARTRRGGYEFGAGLREEPGRLALAAVPGAEEAFRVLSPSRQKAHVTSVNDAKTDATRQRRIVKVVEELTPRQSRRLA